MPAKGTGLGKGGAKRHRKTSGSEINSLTKAAVRKLARTSGVKRVSADVIIEIRDLVNTFLGEVVHALHTVVVGRSKKHNDNNGGRVSVADVQHVLKRVFKLGKAYGFEGKFSKGEQLIARCGAIYRKSKKSKKSKKPAATEGAKKKKTRRSKPGMAALREIRYSQKGACYHIPLASFTRILKAQDVPGGGKLTYSRQAIALLLHTTEFMIKAIFSRANHSAIHGKRVTLTAKDVRLVIRLIHSHDFAGLGKIPRFGNSGRYSAGGEPMKKTVKRKSTASGEPAKKKKKTSTKKKSASGEKKKVSKPKSKSKSKSAEKV